MSEDPIGFAGGDENFYRYAFSNPILRKDPFGLDACINVQLWHTTVVVDDPNGEGKITIDFYPPDEQLNGLYSPVLATVNISSGEPVGAFELPNSCTTQSKEEDKALIERAKELQRLANSGELKYNAFGAYSGTLNCWMFSGAIR